MKTLSYTTEYLNAGPEELTYFLKCKLHILSILVFDLLETTKFNNVDGDTKLTGISELLEDAVKHVKLLDESFKYVKLLDISSESD